MLLYFYDKCAVEKTIMSDNRRQLVTPVDGESDKTVESHTNINCTVF